MMIIYASASILKNKKIRWITLLFGMALGSVLHGALLIFSGAMFIFVFYTFLQIRVEASFAGRIFWTAFIGGTGFFLAYTLLGNIAYNVDDGLVAAVQSFNEGATSINARATYREDVYFSGPLDFVLFLPVAFFQYMMEPLPNRLGSPADVALFMENVARIALLLAAIAVNFRLDQKSRVVHSFILLSYIGICLIWSIGTVNWGTAARHHVPGLGLLLLAAFYSVGIKEGKIVPCRRETPTNSG